MTTTLDAATDVFAVLPSAVRLAPSFDPDRLSAELTVLTQDTWRHQRTYSEEGASDPYPADWRVLSLRSPGGDDNRTDAGGPGPAPFANTRRLTAAPYLAGLLASLPPGVRSARLMSLAPGASVDTHRDTPLGFGFGMVRLHVPLVTNPDAVLVLDGEKHCWQPGTFWYGDFSRPHSIANTGDVNRVHLVIDTALSQPLLELFPTDFTRGLNIADIIFERPPVALRPEEWPTFRGRITAPAQFMRWSAETLDCSVTDPKEKQLVITAEPDGLFLVGDDGSPIGLVHVGGGEFRLQGWTDERMLHIDRRTRTVRFLIRNASSWWTAQRPLETPEPELR
jgi:hypothetical protein